MLEGILISIVGLFLHIGAYLFDSAMEVFVLTMGTQINNTGIGVGITVAWEVVRDLVNLTFIFGLIYVGLRTILGSITDVKKVLASIIIGALLVNFSLFISKVVIDVANVTSVEIYEQIRGDSQYSLATMFMANMGLVRLASPNLSDEVLREVISPDGAVNLLAFALGSSIFILVAAFVFAAGALLLTIRFGFLILLMILSPIAFAAQVLPNVSKWSGWWWKSLFSQAFFAPAYLFMLYITLKVSEGYNAQMGGFDKIFSADTSDVTAGFTTAVFFVLTIVLMVASLLIAKQMGALGSKQVMSAGKKGRQYALRATGAASFGAVGALGRRTVGSAAYGATQSKGLQRLQARSGLAGFVGRNTMKLAKGGAAASFDARRVGGVGKKLSLGEGKKGGYAQSIKDVQKKEIEMSKDLGADDSFYEAYKVADKHQEKKSFEAEREEKYRALSKATDPKEKLAIATAISKLNEDIQKIEKDDTYKAAKAAAEGALKREYAANLEKRGDSLPPGVRMLFARSKRKNKEAADAIRKELGKDKTEKLIAGALKGNQDSGEKKEDKE